MMDCASALDKITAEIANANISHQVTIEAVSKQQPQYKIQSLLEHGHRVFAENKVQEAKQHWEHLRELYTDVKLHLIGALQRNKVRQAVALFDVIETIDSMKLAHETAIEAQKINKQQHIMLQVNIGAEAQKSGVMLTDLHELVDFCVNNQWLELNGLMCIPPYYLAPEPYFAQMQTLQQQFQLPHLSMGMSSDYMSAINFGATHVRLGTVLFGERNSPHDKTSSGERQNDA